MVRATVRANREWLAEQIPGAKHVTIDNAGHMSPIEQPEAVATSIRNFIETLWPI